MDLQEGAIHWKLSGDDLFLGTYTSRFEGPLTEEEGWIKYDDKNRDQIVNFLVERVKKDAEDLEKYLPELNAYKVEMAELIKKAARLGGSKKRNTKHRISKKKRMTRRNQNISLY